MEIGVTDQNFKEEVLERSNDEDVLLVFWAPWCSGCKLLSPVIRKITNEYNDKFVLGFVNVDDNKFLSKLYKIKSIPTILLFRNGNLMDGFTGAKSDVKIKAWLKKNGISSPLDQPDSADYR